MDPVESPSPHQEPLLKNRLGWLIFSLAILVFPAWSMLNEIQREAQAPPIFTTPESIPLVNHEGSQVELMSYRGDIVVVSFMFTRCPDICPALTSQFLELEAQVPAEVHGTPIHFISITVDPEYDRPDILMAYRDQFQSTPDRWQLWTGEQADIDATVAEFQQALDRILGGEAPQIVHSDRFIVLDQQGRMRNFYTTDEPGLTGLVADLDIIAKGF